VATLVSSVAQAERLGELEQGALMVEGIESSSGTWRVQVNEKSTKFESMSKYQVRGQLPKQATNPCASGDFFPSYKYHCQKVM